MKRTNFILLICLAFSHALFAGQKFAQVVTPQSKNNLQQ